MWIDRWIMNESWIGSNNSESPIHYFPKNKTHILPYFAQPVRKSRFEVKEKRVSHRKKDLAQRKKVLIGSPLSSSSVTLLHLLLRFSLLWSHSWFELSLLLPFFLWSVKFFFPSVAQLASSSDQWSSSKIIKFFFDLLFIIYYLLLSYYLSIIFIIYYLWR